MEEKITCLIGREKWTVKWRKEAELRNEKQGEDKLTNFLDVSLCFRDSLHFLSIEHAGSYV